MTSENKVFFFVVFISFFFFKQISLNIIFYERFETIKFKLINRDNKNSNNNKKKINKLVNVKSKECLKIHIINVYKIYIHNKTQ